MAVVTGRWRNGRDLPIWIALAVLLFAGWATKQGVESRVTQYADPHGSVRVSYPQRWVPAPASQALLDVVDPLSGGGVPTELVVTRTTRPAQATPGQVANRDILERARTLPLFRALSVDPVTVGGRTTVEVRYAYVADPQGAALETQRLPVVVRGIELIVPSGANLYRIDVRTAASRYEAARPGLERVLRGVRP